MFQDMYNVVFFLYTPLSNWDYGKYPSIVTTPMVPAIVYTLK